MSLRKKNKSRFFRRFGNVISIGISLGRSLSQTTSSPPLVTSIFLPNNMSLTFTLPRQPHQPQGRYNTLRCVRMITSITSVTLQSHNMLNAQIRLNLRGHLGLVCRIEIKDCQNFDSKKFCHFKIKLCSTDLISVFS